MQLLQPSTESLLEEPLNYTKRLMFACTLVVLCLTFIAVVMFVSNKLSDTGGKAKPAARAGTHGDGISDRAPRTSSTKSPAALPGNSAKRRFSQKTISDRGSSKPVTQKCGGFSLTYCSRNGSVGKRHYYDAATKSCEVASAEAVHVCLRGPNRFVSLEHCKRSCAGTRKPTRRCSADPVFKACTGGDVKQGGWFPDGKGGCSKWKFRKGHCPDGRRTVFKNRTACMEACASRGDDLNEAASASNECKPANAVVCGSSQLLYPFFAVRTKGKHAFACLQSSERQLSHHQCLTGANAFETAASCRKACARHGGRRGG